MGSNPIGALEMQYFSVLLKLPILDFSCCTTEFCGCVTQSSPPHTRKVAGSSPAGNISILFLYMPYEALFVILCLFFYELFDEISSGIRLACGKFELTNLDSAGGKILYCPDVNVS